MALTLITAPAVGSEPITLDEVKMQVLQGQSVDDGYLADLIIPAARERCEVETGRALLTQTWDWTFDLFPDEEFIELPKPPLQSVTHLKYYDSAGTLQTWAATNYVVQAPAGPRSARGRLALAYGKTWPTTYGQQGDVTIRFICGYGDPKDVPTLLKAGMLLDCGTLYAFRENVIAESRGLAFSVLPGGVRDIYRSFSAPATQRAWSR